MANLAISRSKLSRRFYAYVICFLFRYEILFGGRGSGKSTHIAIKLLSRALIDEYFLCMTVRKVHDTIRDSQFALLKQAIKYMGWDNEFKVSESTMAIVCLRNGNKFIAKGLDKAEKTKSVAEPTHVWVEEADQITFDDFDTLNKALRSPKTQNCITLSFNTFIPETHWIRTTFFDKERTYELAADYQRPDVLCMHTTFRDNDFIDQVEYERTLMLTAAGNPHKMRSDLKGEWGVEPNDFPWLYAFTREKHVRKTLPFYPTFPVYLSFDFNRDPITCMAAQMSPQKGTANSFVHFIKEFGGTVQTAELCQQIKTYFPASIFFITGDSSGRKGDPNYNSKHDSAYSLIKGYLGLTDKQIQDNTFNLLHENSRFLMNYMFNSYPKLLISEHGCPNFVHDCEIAEVDQESALPNHLRKDRGKFKMDYFDGGRYFFQRYFHEWVKKVVSKLPPPPAKKQAA